MTLNRTNPNNWSPGMARCSGVTADFRTVSSGDTTSVRSDHNKHTSTHDVMGSPRDGPLIYVPYYIQCHIHMYLHM